MLIVLNGSLLLGVAGGLLCIEFEPELDYVPFTYIVLLKTHAASCIVAAGNSEAASWIQLAEELYRELG